MEGGAKIVNKLFLGAVDFNDYNQEGLVGPNKVKMLSFLIGDLIIVTVEPNGHGWFEGYNASDPNKMCGISHINGMKKINFS